MTRIEASRPMATESNGLEKTQAAAPSVSHMLSSVYDLCIAADGSKRSAFERCLVAAGRGGIAVLMAADWWAKCDEAVADGNVEKADHALAQLISVIRDDLGDPRAALQVFETYGRFVPAGPRSYSNAQEERSRCYAALDRGSVTTSLVA